MTIIGVDEAGRGPALGPMILVGVCIQRKNLKLLRKIGVKDSKKFGSNESAKKKRAQIAKKICQLARVKVEIVSVYDIDHNNLNMLEICAARHIIHTLYGDHSEIFLDGHNLFKPLGNEFSNLHAIDRADEIIEVVGAASIVAKHFRDWLWNKIFIKYKKEFGEIKGNGYGKQAVQFAESYFNKYERLPPEVRCSWSNVKKILENKL